MNFTASPQQSRDSRPLSPSSPLRESGRGAAFFSMEQAMAGSAVDPDPRVAHLRFGEFELDEADALVEQRQIDAAFALAPRSE